MAALTLHFGCPARCYPSPPGPLDINSCIPNVHFVYAFQVAGHNLLRTETVLHEPADEEARLGSADLAELRRACPRIFPEG